jgi:hypothetical protein
VVRPSLFLSIHPSAWKRHSANFACWVETSPFLALPIAAVTLAETEGINDLILGRLPEVAPVAVSVPWGFEKFDGVARGIL